MTGFSKEKLFASLLDKSSLVIFCKDLQGNYVFANSEFEKLFGFQQNEILGKNDFDIFPTEIADKLRATDLNVIQNNESVEIQEEFIANGQKKIYSTFKYPVLNSFGDIVAVAAIANEVSDKIKLLDQMTWHNRMLNALNEAEIAYMNSENNNEIFNKLLQHLLELTASEYGLIGEILYVDEGLPYLKTNAITNIAWNDELKEFLNHNFKSGLEFRNLNSLLGVVIATGKPVLTNQPSEDPRRGGLPEGHPPLRNFFGIPFYAGKEFVGMIGIANRLGGYEASMADDLKPMLNLFASLVIEKRARLQKEVMENELKDNEAKFHAVYQNIIDGMVTIRYNGTIEDTNWAIEKLFGYKKEELIGKNVNILMPNPYHEEHDQYLKNYLTSGIPKIIGIGREVVGRRKDGSLFPMDLAVSEVKVQGSRLFVGSIRDITERKQHEEKIRQIQTELEKANQQLMQLATTDGLTGIANRRYFDDRILHAFKHFQRENGRLSLSLLLFDIDFFKAYNDFYGHQEGDWCLKEVAKFSQQFFQRETDIVARYGGEEFGVILPGVSDEDALELAKKFCLYIEEKKIIHEKSSISPNVTISLGVSGCSSHFLTTKEWIEEADRALYQAKSLGRNRAIMVDKRKEE